MNMKRFPIALQLYSVREEMQKNWKETIRQIREMGYEGVELAGLYGISPLEIRDMLQECELIPVAAHVPYLELVNNLSFTIEQYHTIGCQYIVIPYLAEEYRLGTPLFSEVIENIKKIGEFSKKYQMPLLYHNHDFEFKNKIAGTYALDYLYERIPETFLQTELDICWITVAGESPTAYIKKYANRCPIVHIKDFKGSKEHSNFSFCSVGSGVQDIPMIVRTAKESGTKWFVVEQDMHSEYTALEDAKRSIEYFTQLEMTL